MLALGTLSLDDCRAEHDRSTRVSQTSDFDLFRDLKGIVDLNAKVPHRALDLLVPKKQLRRPQVPRATVDESHLCTTLIPRSE